MRLYLSSLRLGNHSDRLMELVASRRPRVAVIMNALDVRAIEKRQALYERMVADLSALRADIRELDLRSHFAEASPVIDRLATCDLVWAAGGNAFTLLAAMKQSGFVSALRTLLDEDRIVYGGHSAGAMVATPTLRGIELVDSPEPMEALPLGYASQIHWDGMGLVEYSIAPHFQSDHWESEAINGVVRYFENHGMPYRTLRDGEVLLVDGDEESILTGSS